MQISFTNMFVSDILSKYYCFIQIAKHNHFNSCKLSFILFVAFYKNDFFIITLIENNF